MTNRVDTTVYLNEAPNSFLGFNRINPAQLRRAATFELPIPTGTRPQRSAIDTALAQVFEQLNIDTPTAAWAQQYRAAGNRSLSVGDVVAIGETAWAVASFGWTPVSAEQLSAAITR